MARIVILVASSFPGLLTKVYADSSAHLRGARTPATSLPVQTSNTSDDNCDHWCVVNAMKGAGDYCYMNWFVWHCDEQNSCTPNKDNCRDYGQICGGTPSQATCRDSTSTEIEYPESICDDWCETNAKAGPGEYCFQDLFVRHCDENNRCTAVKDDCGKKGQSCSGAPSEAQCQPAVLKESMQALQRSSTQFTQHNGNFIGQIMSGSHCLGVDVQSDDGYAIKLFNCDANDDTQNFDNTFNLMRSPVIEATAGPPGCWYVNPQKSFYFDKGQILTQNDCPQHAFKDVSNDSPQEFAVHWNNRVPAGVGHHIHHGNQCVEVSCDRGRPLDFKDGDCKLMIASCNYDYNDGKNSAQLFVFKR